LAPRVVAYLATRDLIPLYAVYSLLFRDAGLSAAQISSLLVIWSLTSFVFEIPSGAWADTIDRRSLLVLSAIVYACGFTAWMLWPAYLGFALGFVLWGLSGSLMSGTFEALLYDELSSCGATDAYATLMGWANGAAMGANLAATAVAAPLFAWGGYGLVGWSSVGLAILHGVLARCLPRASAVEPADQLHGADGRGPLFARYVGMLRDGLSEVTQRPRLRRVMLICAALTALDTYDEYFPLLIRESGTAMSSVPVVLAVIVGAQAVGTALAGRTERWAPRAVGWLVGVGVVLISTGALSGGLPGYLAIAVGYGVLNNLIIVSEARFQHVIESSARATVTSVAGVSTEVFAISVYGFAALGSTWWSISTVVAALGLPGLIVATLVPRWLPRASRRPATR
jgi:MFS family permease